MFGTTPKLRQVLRRAVGLDTTLTVDYDEGELVEGDIFLLVSDGVWGAMADTLLSTTLISAFENMSCTAQDTAEAIAAAALSHGGNDNASALVLRVLLLPPAGQRDSEEAVRRLPLPPRLSVGDLYDGFIVEAVLHDSRETLLYRVRDEISGEQCVLKTLVPDLEEDEPTRTLLAREVWMLSRAASRHLPQVIPLAAGRASAAYILISWHEGDTLQQLLDAGRHFTVSDAANLGTLMLKGLGALHRLDILHRDIKPDNLHLGADGVLRLLDLGVAVTGSDEATSLANTNGATHQGHLSNPGTPIYMAPELLSGTACSVESDLYAVGVTLYHLLTRKYPYGEIEPFQHPRYGDPVAPTRYRPETPAWLEEVLLKAVAREKKARFTTAEEFLLALERGDRSRLRVPRRSPLLERNPALFWRGLSVVSVIVNLVLLFLLNKR